MFYYYYYYSRGIILAHFMSNGPTVTARYYSEIISKENTQRKTEKDASQASPLKSPFACQCLLSYFPFYNKIYQLLQVAIVRLTSVQPRPCPCDFYLFPELKRRLTRNKYETRAAFISTVNRYLSIRSTLWFVEGILKLPRRWQKCIDIGGEYFEKQIKKTFWKLLNGFWERYFSARPS